MKLVGKIGKLSGSDKKSLVTDLLIYIVNNTDSGEYDKVTDAILLAMIPVVIDKLIEVENGKLVFNPKIKKTCLGFC